MGFGLFISCELRRSLKSRVWCVSEAHSPLVSASQPLLPWPGHFPCGLFGSGLYQAPAMAAREENPAHDHALPIVTFTGEQHLCGGLAPLPGFRWAFHPAAAASRGNPWAPPRALGGNRMQCFQRGEQRRLICSGQWGRQKMFSWPSFLCVFENHDPTSLYGGGN